MKLSLKRGFGPSGVIFCAFFTFAAVACAGTYSGGTGTAANPYKISKAADWQELIAASGDWDKQFTLLNDIDFGGASLTPVAPDTVIDWDDEFIGTPFRGVFDGQGHTLGNLTISFPEQDFVALFGYVTTTGIIRHLGVVNIHVEGYRHTGGLVGQNEGEISDCTISGNLVAYGESDGGLCGENWGPINDCHSSVDISGEWDVGGLCGVNGRNTLRDCSAAGTVSGGAYIGGLCGANYGWIVKSIASAEVEGSWEVGGLCGRNQKNVLACSSSGSVTGTNVVGGLIGFNNRADASFSYSTGKVRGYYNVGGCIGANTSATVMSCFWDIETSEQTDGAGGKGLTTSQMKTMQIFQNTRWAGQGWILNEGIDYPRLAWEGTGGVPIPAAQPLPLGGSGTEADPYRVGTVEEFALLSWYADALGRSFILTSDLDLSGVDLDPIGDLGPFTGVFDGMGHVLRNSVINLPTSDSVGLFRQLGTGGHIRNLKVVDADIQGLDTVGGLVGMNENGTISRCSITGQVQGGVGVGGLAGNNQGVISNTAARSRVQGDHDIGGLCGYNTGTISDSYAMGDIAGTRYGIGGLVGFNDSGKIHRCYATGKPTGTNSVGGLCGYKDPSVTEDIGNFWDMQASQKTTSAMGTGKTTGEMKALSTFTSAGWDFVGETANGTADIWWMPFNSYPRFIWEKKYAGGSGTVEDPYSLSTVADWGELIATSADWDRHFILINDIDFGGANLTPVAPDTNPDNEDFDGTAFSGGFDGNGHVLRNAVISMSDSDFVGLFGRISYGAEVRNLGIDNIAVAGNRWVGGLCGHNLGGNIRRCYSTGDVSGFESAGGLCGLNENIISECHATGNVVGSDGVGGLCGYNYSGAVLACYASGTVTGEWGLGGLCGANEGTIRDCYARGGVDGNDSLGGLVGATVGGTITFCYSAGKVGNGSGAGGFVGACDITPITACFWDLQTSEQDRGTGGGFCGRVTGLTTAEMKIPAVFTGAGWDFVGEATNGTEDVWRMCVDGVDYPRLSWEFSRGGDMDCPDGVAFEDLMYLAERWMAGTPEMVGAVDANGDGKVDLNDFGVMAENWMRM